MDNLTDWLFDIADAPIRYRVAREFMGLPEKELKPLQSKLLDNSAVMKWVDLLHEILSLPMLHGSFDTNFENFMGRLATLGLHKGIAKLDTHTKGYLKWLAQAQEKTSDYAFTDFYFNLCTAFLSYAGYFEGPVEDFFYKRLDTLSEFAKKKNYEIYIPWGGVHKEPSFSKGRRLINPDIYGSLPFIHDLVFWVTLPKELQGSEKIGAVIEYIMDERYQELHDGYGLVWGGRKYYSAGWSAHLPKLEDNGKTTRFLLYLSLLVAFPAARKSPWTKKAVKFLEGHKTSSGTYLFPPNFLTDSSGYFVSGYGLGLGQDRRKKIWREIESTFWLELIRKRLES